MRTAVADIPVPTEIDPDLYYTAKFIADRYGIDQSTLWRWVGTGRFPKPTKLTPGCSRWLGRALLDHERSKTP